MNRRAFLTGLLITTASISAQDDAKNDPRLSPREKTAARYFPNVILRTHEGKSVKFYDDLVKDKIVLINFFYLGERGGVSEKVTANLLEVQRLLGDRVGRDIFMYSITLNPEKDNPAALKKYAEERGIGPGWLFLTGELANIETLRKKLGFSDPDPAADADKLNHIGNLRYGNEAKLLWGSAPSLAKAKFIAENISWISH